MARKKYNQNKKNYRIWLLAFAAFIIPLAVHSSVHELSLVEQVAVQYSTHFYNVPGYIKMQLLVLVGFVAFVWMLLEYKKLTEKKVRPYLILVIGYLVLMVISTLNEGYLDYVLQNFSSVSYDLNKIIDETSNIGIVGYATRYEGALSLFAYMSLFLFAMISLKNEEDYLLILKAVVVSVGVFSIIGLLQYFKMDPFRMTFVQQLVQVFGAKTDLSRMGNFAYQRTVYGTLYNPNLVGSYGALLLPITISAAFVFRDIKAKIIVSAISIMLLIVFFASKSVTGVFSLVMIGLFGIVLLWRELKVYRKWIFGSIITIIALLVVVISFTELEIPPKYADAFVSLINLDDSSYGADYEVIENVWPIESGVRIVTDRNEIRILNKNTNNYLFQDKNGEPLKLYMDEEKVFYFESNEYETYKIRFLNEGLVVRLTIDEIDFYLEFHDGIPYMIGTNDNLYPIDSYEVPSIGFANLQQFATERGYIWSKTIPIALEHIIIGTGPDTFSVVFPNYDIISKANLYGLSTMNVDKAHNLYLQMAVQTGGLSLIIFLMINGMYFVSFFKGYKKIKNPFYYRVSIGISCGIFGYLITGLGNDSVVAIASVYWIFMGAGIALLWITSEGRRSNVH